MSRGPRRHTPKRPAKQLPDSFSLRIDRFSHDGRGIGRKDGRVVMVQNALPGETVTVKINKASSKLWQGVASHIDNHSPDRAAPACRHFSQCGGCQLQHIHHSGQQRLKYDTITELFERNGIRVPDFSPIVDSEPFNYRHRARLHISKKGALGFHAESENRVVPIEQCLVMSEALQPLFDQLKAGAPLKGVQQVELVIDDFGQAGLYVVKAAKAEQKALESWALAQKWHVKESLSYKAGGYTLRARPGQFTQVNRAVNQTLISRVRDWMGFQPDDRLLDLFCGNGNLSIPFINDVQGILGFEASEASIEEARQATADAKTIEYAVADLFTVDLHEQETLAEFAPTIAILDPPRAGAERVVQWLSKVPSVKKVLYISCDPATLARDVKQLIDDKWHLRKLSMIDMFPQTRHIETMVLLEK